MSGVSEWDTRKANIRECEAGRVALLVSVPTARVISTYLAVTMIRIGALVA